MDSKRIQKFMEIKREEHEKIESINSSNDSFLFTGHVAMRFQLKTIQIKTYTFKLFIFK